MTPQELYTLWQTVKAFREEMHPYFPTPNENDSLAFALTEVAEAVDAQLRQNPVYKRNNNKAHTVERELAQCAMMLLTSMKQPSMPRGEIIVIKPKLQHIALLVAELWNNPDYINGRWRAVLEISTMIDLPTELAAELDRMRAKFGPFLVVDTAAAHHRDALIEKDWIIDLDRPIWDAMELPEKPVIVTVEDC